MINFEDFSRKLGHFFVNGLPDKIAVAVSGGADSLCLCLLTHDWAIKNNISLVALTVDHLLREESSSEALQVHQWLKSRGIEHYILPWEKKSFPKNIQESARKARYELLTAWCGTNEVLCLGVAHNAQDQYETILQRLAHHSGPIGLAGMDASLHMGDLRVIRPLLGYTRQEILQTLQSYGQDWVEDPSNQNPKYTRIQIRQNHQALEAKGLTASRILSFQKKMEQNKNQFRKKTLQYLQGCVTMYEAGYINLKMADFHNLSYEIQSLVLSHVLQRVSGKYYVPGRQTLHEALSRIKEQRQFTCHGCQVVFHQKEIFVVREYKNVEPPRFFQERDSLVWDNRFYIQIRKADSFQDLRVQALGPDWLQFKDNIKIMNLPPAVRPTLPSVWRKESLLSMPFLDYYDTLEATFELKVLNYNL